MTAPARPEALADLLWTLVCTLLGLAVLQREEVGG